MKSAKNGWRPFFKILAAQFAAAALIFFTLLIFKNVKTSAAKSGYQNIMTAFLYEIPVSDGDDDDIGKIKFVNSAVIHSA